MSFDEFMFSARFNQKTAKEDLFVKENQAYPRWYLCGKTLEDSRAHSTKAGPMPLPCGASQPHYQADRPMGPTWRSLFAMLVLHHLKVCIYVVLLSKFDPRSKLLEGPYIYLPVPSL
jgi:hypothetical protein